MGGYYDDGAAASVINYSTTEQTLNETWTGGEAIYQKTVSIGTLPNTTTKTVAHGITSLGVIINSIAWCDNGTNQTPVDYSSPTVGISLYVDDTNINIVTVDDRSTFTGFVTLQYTKSA